MMQFFDHYLKGAPGPLWMTRSVPACSKAVIPAFDDDTIIKTPGTGLLMENDGALSPRQKKIIKAKTFVDDKGRILD